MINIKLSYRKTGGINMQKSLITKTLVCGIVVLFVGAGALIGVGEVPENIDLGSKDDVLCGDCNNDSIVNVGDVVYLITYLYRGGSPPRPMLCVGDVNCDDAVNVGDVVYMITCLYRPIWPCEPCEDCCNPPWG
jgi:hypothetical protein